MKLVEIRVSICKFFFYEIGNVKEQAGAELGQAQVKSEVKVGVEVEASIISPVGGGWTKTKSILSQLEMKL